MKKLLLKALAVMVSGILIYVGVILTFHSFGKVNWLPNAKFTLGGYGHTLQRLNEAENVKDVDLLFIGSSQAYRGFDPRIFQEHGIKSFNLGSSSQTPFASYYLLREHLPRMNPKIVVMDLFWGVLSKDGVEAGVDLISNSEINDEILEMTWRSKDILLFNTLLISSINQLASPLNSTYQKKYKNDVYIKGGFTQSLLEGNKLGKGGLMSLKQYHFKPAPLQLEYLKKIIALCKEQDVELLLTVNPVTKEFKNSVANYNEYASLVEGMARENNLHLIDYNRRTDLNLSSQKDFLDRNHLSQSGVNKFNTLFINDLSKIREVAIAQ